MQEDTSTTNIACSHCSCTFENSKILIMHLNTVHNITRYPCNQCTSTFENQNLLDLHTNSFHHISAATAAPINCKNCQKQFTNSSNLKRHSKICNTNNNNNNGINPLQCNQCGKVYRNKFNRKRHELTHSKGASSQQTVNKIFKCNICNKKYKLNRFLLAHQQKHHKSDFKCLLCPERFASANRLKLHMKLQHNNAVNEQKKKKFPCYNCSQEFGNRIALNRHLRTSCVHLPLDDVNDKGSIMDDIKQCFSIEFTSAIKGCLNKYLFKPKELMANEKQCLDYLKDGIIDTLKFYNESHILLKWSYTMDVQFTRPNHATGEDEFKNAAFSSDHQARDNTDIDQLDDQLTDMSNDIIQRIDKYSKEGSGWILCKIISFKLDLYRFRLSSGGKPVTIPAVLALKHCVMNIDSDNCFKWAILCSLHHQDITYNPNRITSYTQWENEFEFPTTSMVTANQICDFVKKTKLPVFTHQYTVKKENGYVECTYRPPKQIIIDDQTRCVHLLLYDGHWMAITNLSALYRKPGTKYTFKMCPACLSSFYKKENYENHLPCNLTTINYIQTEIMPTEPLQFKAYCKCVALSDIIYADMEAILERCVKNDDDDDGDKGLLQKHIPCCVGAYWVSKVEPFKGGQYDEFKGPKCIAEFVDYLEEKAKYLHERNKTQTRVPAEKTAEEMRRHGEATVCIWCRRDFIDGDSKRKKVFDHDHLTGMYRGACCQDCNVKLIQNRKQLVVAFHNFRGYDSHGLCLQGLALKPGWTLKPVSQNSQKYITLTADLRFDDGPLKNKGVFKIKFIDTLQLMNSSLSNLSQNLIKGSGNDYSLLSHSMRMTLQYPTLEERDIAGKGIFPYSYVSSWEKLEENQLPPYDAFYDELEECNVTSQEEYAKAQKMFDAFECKTLFDYQLRYMELDCRLLADVFEEFRRLTMEEDGLDAAHFITVSQLSYDSALKKCGKKIGLIEMPEMYRDIERCKRGGYAFVNKHFCQASNPYVTPIINNTQHSKQDVYLGDVDANNLYGNALRYPLPVGDFKYIDKDEYKGIDWRNVSLNDNVGYFVVCDLHYPNSIHSKTKDFPLAMEVLEIKEDMLPNYFKAVNMRKNLQRNHNNLDPQKVNVYRNSTKLLATCYDKKDYVVHFIALQFYLKMGLIISKIHRVIKFTQEPLFRDYIDYNSKRRQEAKNDFEKDFYKQKNNSLYGKSLENMRNRQDFKLCNSPKSFLSATSQVRFMKVIEFNESLVAAQLTKANVELSSPLAIGAAVLDISKTIMYKIVYDDFPRYEKLFDCKIKVVGGDTDSLFFETHGVDMIGTLFPEMLKDGLLDTSNYDKSHPMYSEKHKAQLGCIKDEFCGHACQEFILLRPKSYSMKMYGNNSSLDKKKSKGVARRKIKLFTHEDFRNVFFNQLEISTNNRRMQTIKHVVYNVEQRKIALSYADDKRAWYSDNFSLPYGYCDAKLYNNINHDDDDDDGAPLRKRLKTNSIDPSSSSSSSKKKIKCN